MVRNRSCTTERRIDQEFLQEIYDNTLILLYRLLFILYAEDRDLIPVTTSGYKASDLFLTRLVLSFYFYTNF